MDRPLAPMERVLYEVDRAYPVNFTTVGHVKGPLTRAAIESALKAVTERHPHLRRRLVAEAGLLWFRDGGAPPGLRWLANAEWIPEADREVNEPFATATGPLLRCVVIEHGATDHTVLLTLHHCIGDGFSGAFLMRDLIHAASGASLAPLADALPMEEGFPPRWRGWRGWWGQAFFLLREVVRTLRMGMARSVRDRPEVMGYDRRARVLSYVLGPELTEPLTARARTERTTVHGALSAAMILASVQDIGRGEGIRVGFGSPINLRRQLQPPIGEEVGLYISMAAWGGRVAPGRDLWDLAREVRSALVSDQERGLHFAAMRAVIWLARLLGAGRIAPRALADRFERNVPSTAGLTNLGKLDITTTFGPLSLERVHFLTSPSMLGAWMATATTLNGHLTWNFTWGEPAISEAHAQALAADSVRRLKEALGVEATIRAAGEVETAPEAGSLSA